MINIKIYKNGYEIIGHAEPHIGSEVSFWHWCTAGLMEGLDHTAVFKRYTTHENNLENINEGLSYMTFDNKNDDLSWIFDDLVISMTRWSEEFWSEQVKIDKTDSMLIK